MKKRPLIILVLSLIMLVNNTSTAQNKNRDIRTIKVMNKAYVTAWLANDTNKIMSLFEREASISPSGSGHFKGHVQIKKFWFPSDSSTTLIDEFENDIIHVALRDTIIITTTNSKLTWRYNKSDFKMGRKQEGFALTFYRKQRNGTWLIWKQIWSDIWSRQN